MDFYKRIRKRREELGLTQDDLAKRMGYKSRSSINKIEMGENDIPQSKIVQFAKALDTTPRELTGWDSSDSGETYDFVSEKSAEIGYRIRTRREAVGLTQLDLGEALGVNKSTITRYESGEVKRIKIPLLKEIARLLDVSPSWLTLKTDEMGKYNTLLGSPADNEPNGSSMPLIGELIRTRRDELNLSLEELGRRIGVSKQTVQKWESGKIKEVKRNHAALIAKVLDIPLETIMGIQSYDDEPDELSFSIREHTGRKIASISQRLDFVMGERGLRQVDILARAGKICEEAGVKLQKTDISQYVSGKTEPSANKLSVLARALDVSEAWLVGYDVPMERIPVSPSEPTIQEPCMPEENSSAAEISSFRGICVSICRAENMTPHFRASYCGEEVIVGINDLNVINGSIPSKQLKMVIGWAALRQELLLESWEMVAKGYEPFAIAPIE